MPKRAVALLAASTLRCLVAPPSRVRAEAPARGAADAWRDMTRTRLGLGLWLAGTFLAVGFGCRVGGVPQGPGALIFGATAIAGTAVYREATGGCWAACNTGWVCNPDTGRCEPERARERPPSLRRAGAARPDGEELDTAAADAGLPRAGAADAGALDAIGAPP